VDGQRVRMLERRGQLDLTLKPFGTQREAGFGVHDLQSHRPIVLHVAREGDDGHPAAASSRSSTYRSRSDSAKACMRQEVAAL
jgi:hypothetical protein